MYPTLIAVIAILFASVYCVTCLRAPVGDWRSFMKTVPLLILGFGALWLGSPWFLVAGLIASAAGDYVLSRAGNRAFLSGLIAFAVAHLFYIVLFWNAGDHRVPIAFGAVVIYGLSCEVWLIRYCGSLRWAVRFYVVMIVAMVGAAMSTGNGVAIAGAVLFAISDSVLAIEKFRLSADDPRQGRITVSVWISYIAAQVLIFLAFA